MDQQYSEGYSLPDDRYEAWLKVNHPDEISATQVHNSEDDGGDKSADQLEGDKQWNSVTRASADYDMSTFTIEQERKYACRFEEGFALPGDPWK